MGKRFKGSKIVWGVFLLLAAAFVLFNQFHWFSGMGVGSIIAVIISLMFIVKCLSHRHFALLPIPFAVLYFVFQKTLELPELRAGTLVLASILASIGLAILLPKTRGYKFKIHKHKHKRRTEIHDTNDNNPSINVSFGGVSHHLCADSLQTARLDCNFGNLEVYFDQMELNPNGAEVIVNCNFGAITLFVPKKWHIVEKFNCTLGNAEIDTFSPLSENVPVLTITGSVTLGSIEIRSV